MQEQTKKKVRDALLDHLKMVAAFISTTGVIFGAGLWVFEPRLTEYMSRISGNDQIVEEMHEQSADLDKLQNTVTQLGIRLDEIAPRRIAEYDVIRSKIFSPCALGTTCEFVYRVRRTAWGLKCSAPVLTAVFEDAAGVVHYPKRGNTPQNIRVRSDWTSVPADFVVPEGASLGVGEFYYVLTYEHCPGVSDPLTEFSAPLVVEIIS